MPARKTPARPKAKNPKPAAKPGAKPAAAVRKPASPQSPARPAAARPGTGAKAPAARTPLSTSTGARPAAPRPAPPRPAAPRPAAPPPASRPPVEERIPFTTGTKVTKKDQKHFEERLLQERRRLLKELGYLEANVLKQNQRDSAGDLSGYSFHMADLGTDAMEREKAFLFASAEGRALYDVDEALRRLYSDNYGICESCGEPIARERLEVVPHARLCVRCKEREEKASRSKAR